MSETRAFQKAFEEKPETYGPGIAARIAELSGPAQLPAHEENKDWWWVDEIFKDYPEWDSEEKAPKALYVTFNVVLEQRDLRTPGEIQRHRKMAAKKATYYATYEHYDKDCWAQLRKVYTPVPIDCADALTFYAQFTREALICVGI